MEKVVEAGNLQFRPVVLSDWEVLLEWRNDWETRAQSRDVNAINQIQHMAWLQSRLQDDDCKFLIAELDGVPVGTVRWEGKDPAEMSWTIAPCVRGRGIGRLMVSKAAAIERMLITAVIRVGNVGSLKIALAAGFLVVSDDGVWLKLQRNNK